MIITYGIKHDIVEVGAELSKEDGGDNLLEAVVNSLNEFYKVKERLCCKLM
ncbi:MAG: hypothetical protein WKF36_11460 [Candidatus Nitrosocosmicus sp.]